MPIVIKVPRYAGKVLPHTVELDVKPPAPHQDSLLPKIHQAALACRDVQWTGCGGACSVAGPTSAGRSGLPHFAINGLDVIEGNEGGPRPLICEA